MNAADEQAPGGLRRASGRDRDEWFAELDAWGAAGRPYGEIAAWLTGQGLSDWWAQKVIVEYEQARGLREAGARPDGTFAGGASRTIGAAATAAFNAFADAAIREQWLPGVPLHERTSRPGRSGRYEFEDGTRLNVDFADKGSDKCQVAVEHTHLSDAQAAADAKAAWRERLSGLKAFLEQ